MVLISHTTVSKMGLNCASGDSHDVSAGLGLEGDNLPYPLPPRRAHEVPWGAQRGAEGGEELDGDGGRRVGWAYMAKSRSPTGEPVAAEVDQGENIDAFFKAAVPPVSEAMEFEGMYSEAMAEKKG